MSFCTIAQINYIHIIACMHQNLMYKGIPMIYPELVPMCRQGILLSCSIFFSPATAYKAITKW